MMEMPHVMWAPMTALSAPRRGGRIVARPGCLKVHCKLARSSAAMALRANDEGSMLGRTRPMSEVPGAVLNDLVLAVREALNI